MKSLNGYEIYDEQARTDIESIRADVSEFSKEIVDHKNDSDIHVTSAEKEEWNNKQPSGDYALTSELEAETTAREQAIAILNEKLGQQTVLVAEGETQEEAEAWLAESGDTTKVYLMPDETFWQCKSTTEVVEGGIAYTNLLPTATDTDGSIYGGDYNGDGVNDGYKTTTRLSGSSGSTESSQEDMCATGFIAATTGDSVRIKGHTPITGILSYLITYDSSKTKLNNQQFYQTDPSEGLDWCTYTGQTIVSYYTYADGVLTIPLTEANFGTGIAFFRFSGHIDENTIVTVNEEIVEGGGTTTTIVEKWVTTGHGLVATNYDEVIANLTNITNTHTEEIQELREIVESGQTNTGVDALTLIRNWDAPIYDANIPVFLLETEKTAMTDAMNTPDSIYAMYDALMEKYPEYITKTDLGVCSDGVNHVYRYDFVEPEPYHSGTYQWSETKIKAILVSGIHYEWAGIYSLYYALEEIAENPDLIALRRNTHFIVLPVLNPYCTIASNYDVSMGVLNANGVQIHRNFEVGFIYPDESGYVEAGGRNHGGTEPLSEMETQCLDNIFKENTDSAFFLTCHNFDTDATYGISFIWPSSATKYMCNMGFRLIDRMSIAWLDKYADELSDGIARYKTDAMSDNHIRFGHAHVSSTDGTETRQATKYGIQGCNVEVCYKFWAHGTAENEELSLSEFTLSRGAETYINFLLMTCGLYDYKDKKEYFG